MILQAPLSEATVRSLRLGQEVRVSGPVVIGRDEVHLRALEMHREGEPLPVDLRDGILFHCGPIAQKNGESWDIIAAGPTTSARMNAVEPAFIEAFGIRAIIGKGGMSRPTVEAMQQHGCVYLAMTGGAAVLAARGIRAVKKVEWLDLGMPEALWVVEAHDLGPMIVAIDAHGNSMYEAVDRGAESALAEIKRTLQK